MRASSVWAFAFLLALTSGCADRVPPVVRVEYQLVTLPGSFLVPCARSQWTPGGTFRDMAELALRLASEIDECNARLTGAREWQNGEKSRIPKNRNSPELDRE